MNNFEKTKDDFLDESPSEPLYIALKNIKKAQTVENITAFEKIFKKYVDEGCWLPLICYKEEGFPLVIIEERGKYYAAMLSHTSQLPRDIDVKVVITDINKLIDRVFGNEEIDGIVIDPFTTGMFIEKYYLLKIISS